MKLPRFEKVWNIIALGSLPLLLLDLAVTGTFWWFAENAILNIPQFFTIPFEELLFFITVPYAILTLDANLATITSLNKQQLSNKGLPLLVLLLALWGTFLLAIGWLYTATMCIMLSISLVVASQYSFIKSVRFTLVLTFTILLTAIFNMYLTALPVVLYNSALKSNAMFGTIPYEDFLFGLILIINLFTAREYAQNK